MTKFGVQLPRFSGFDPADLCGHVAGLATTAEEAGFDSVWVMDHFTALDKVSLCGRIQPRRLSHATTLLNRLYTARCCCWSPAGAAVIFTPDQMTG
jgi:alkanesulfonate monooxygenase SsuD/methylene tetrahydromethanopterin reductase-like flavin-dependent oxidoreductase (luciferase family)